MPRLYPPVDFQCLYKDYCPYLYGMSTKWVGGAYQRSYKEHCEHWRVREILQDRVSEALSKVTELEKENE